MNAIHRTEATTEPLQNVLDQLLETIAHDAPTIERLSDHELEDRRRHAIHQHELEKLPGITFNTFDADGPVWLSVEHLAASDPPAVESDLAKWIDVSSDPNRRPLVRQRVTVTVPEQEKERMVADGHARVDLCSPATGHSGNSGLWNVRLHLEHRSDLVERLDHYLSGPWAAWAAIERPRRRTIAIHQRLREMARAADSGDHHRGCEIVWGLGVSRWRRHGHELDLPLLERLVTIELLDGSDAELRIRPRLAGATANLRAFEPLTSAARAAADTAGQMLERGGELSPFTPSSFEPILSAIGAQLDPQGIYCPTSPDSALLLPDESGQLVVSDRWVIFARPRSETLLRQDIERLRRAMEYTSTTECCLAGIGHLLLGAADHDAIDSPRRKLSGVIGDPIDIVPDAHVTTDRGDLFFPLPTNSDQMEIVRQLRRSNGVVVRGAIGPDRRSAIANVVCHHLALGLRVLIVSRNDLTLALLAEKLPGAVRDLTLDLTGSDKDVLKHAEGVIGRLQTILDNANLRDQAELVNRLEQDIIATSHTISRLDDEVADIASRTARRSGDGAPSFEQLAELASDRDDHAWFTDRPLKFVSETDLIVAAIEQARQARLRLGDDLAYVDDHLPEADSLPDAATMARLHRDLQPIAAGKTADNDDNRLARLAIAALDPEGADRFAGDLDALAEAHRIVAVEPWLGALSPVGAAADEIPASGGILVDFARDASSLLSRRAGFLVKPVDAPTNAFSSDELLAAVERLSSGQRAFATLSLTGRALKQTMDAIRVAGFPPKSAADWAHVRDYLTWRRHLHSLDVRWRSLAAEIGAPPPQQDSSNALHDHERVVRQVEAAIVMASLAKRNVLTAAAKLPMPDGEIALLLADGPRLASLASVIRSGATRVAQQRTELARLTKLFDGSGAITARVQAEVLSQIGRDDVDAHEVETRWTAIVAVVQRLHDRRQDIELIQEVCAAATEAGAGALARRIRTEPARQDIGDPLLVEDWTVAWNWAVLMRQTEGLGQHQRLQDLSGQRAALETRLRELFEQVVVARMQLDLAQNSSGGVRQAFNLFTTTLRKLATTCSGPSASRLRQKAREALEACHDGIPCHLMPAWRVAEHLPARLGAFDLVVVDDASQSDLRDLTVLLRGRKVLAVAEDHPVEEKIGAPARRDGAPVSMRQLMPPKAALCELLQLLFPNRMIRLREHARRVAPLAVSMAGPSPALVPLEAAAPVQLADDVVPVASAATRSASSLEDEIATVAEGLSLARQDRHAEPPLPMEGPAPDWLRSRTDAEVAEGDARPSRRSPRAVAPPERPTIVAYDVTVAMPAPTEIAETPSSLDDAAPPAVATNETTPAKTTTARIGVAKLRGHAVGNHLPHRRPADRVSAQPRRTLRRRAVAAAAVIVVAMIGGSIYWRPAPGGIAASWRTISNQFAAVWNVASPAAALPDSTAPHKVTAERLTPDGRAAATGPVEPAQSQAVLYQEDAQDPLGKRYLGKVTWRVEPAAGSVPASLKGDVEIDKRMKATLSLRRNIESDMPASHILEVKFNLPDDPAYAGVETLKGVSMKAKEAGRGAALATLTAKVTPEFFMIALSAGEVDTKRNVLLLKGKEWIDIPIVYNGGSRAVLAIEKGAEGDRAFKDAFSAWGQ
ncbi:helicase [Bradyrhizobium sp. SRS-191]|uniref:helicase n=1 Tax=Bradyrhizobium sp. SRS-191 TaxID=2962606 RepID=UPI00211EA59D|nr:helicase [Bradyrhizobium sp. SRS-191]